MTQLMTVNFHGNALYGREIGGTVFVAPKPIVEAMGLAWQSQLARIKRHHVLRQGITVMVIPTSTGPQSTVGLRLNLVPGWLFSISSPRIKDPATRRTVELFQHECFEVLWEHFSGKQRVLSISRRWIDLIHETRMLFGRRAAVQLWRVLGLPEVPAMQEAFRQLELFDKRA